MGYLRRRPSARLRKNHPLLTGCQLLLLFEDEDTTNLRDALHGRVLTAVGANRAALQFRAGNATHGSALKFTAADSHKYTMPVPPGVNTAGSFTVGIRINPGAAHVGGLIGTYEPGVTNGGWLVYCSSAAGDPALGCTVFNSTGGSTFAAGPGTSGGAFFDILEPTSYVMRYDDDTRTMTWFRDQKLVHSVANTSADWNPTSGANLVLGHFFFGTDRYSNAAVNWLAYYNRKLSDAECLLLCNDRQWPFLDTSDDLFPLWADGASFSFTASATAGSTAGLTDGGGSAVMAFAASAEFGGDFGGDVASVPEPDPGPVVWTFGASAGAAGGGVGAGGGGFVPLVPPSLYSFAASATAAAAALFDAPWRFVSSAVAGGRLAAFRPDGRRDVLGTIRYKR